MNSQFRYIILISVLLCSIFLFWLCTISHVGLHGDEAWFGLKANEYLQTGIDLPYGMNYYTGILQNLANALVFKISGVGIAELRISGVMMNMISLLMIAWILFRRTEYKMAVVFMLLMAQSGLYLIYPKIAWEVCSFTLFFLTLCSIALMKVFEKKDLKSPFWMFVFLVASIAGTYNHILFSSFPLGLIAGYAIWRLYNKQTQPDNIFPLLLLNMVNLVWFHLFMKYAIDRLWMHLSWFSFLLPIGILILEVVFRNKKLSLLQRITSPFFQIRFAKPLAIGLLVVAALSFLIFHSITFFEIAAQRILFLQIYSFELHLLPKQIFLFATAILFLFLGYALFNDIRKVADKPFAFLLLGYLGVFTMYTQSYSIRYYLIMMAMVFVYLAYALARQKNISLRNIILGVLMINAVAVQVLLWDLSTDDERKIKAIDFKIGNNRNTETSAHFLPFTSVIDFAKVNEIGRIETSEDFFIGNPFRFYKVLDPSLSTYPNTATVEYDKESTGSGFVIEKINTLRE